MSTYSPCMPKQQQIEAIKKMKEDALITAIMLEGLDPDHERPETQEEYIQAVLLIKKARTLRALKKFCRISKAEL